MSTRDERSRGRQNRRGFSGTGPSSRGSSNSRGGQSLRGTSPGPASGRGAPVAGGERGSRGNRRRGRTYGRVFLSPAATESIQAPPEEEAECDPRIQTIEDGLATLIDKFPPTSDPENPTRPGFGTLGQPIHVRANFFALKFPEGLIVYDYNVDMTPKSDLGRLKGKIFRALEHSPEFAQYKAIVAHDSSQRLVAAAPLPQPLVIHFEFSEESDGQSGSKAKIFTITITKTKEWDAADLSNHVNGEVESKGVDIGPLISALNLVVQTSATRKGIRVGKNRHFFDPTIGPIGDGVEAWRGYFASVRPVWKNMMVNINVCTTAFIESKNLGDVIVDYMKASFGSLPRFGELFGKSTLRVRTRHLGYQRTVRDIVDKKPSDHKFHCDEFGRRVTVGEYFALKYPNHPINPELPLVDIGSQKKPTYVPADLCDIIVGVPFRGRLSGFQTRNMLGTACKAPQVNSALIRGDGFQRLDLIEPHETMASFGLVVDTKMTVVPARILQPPGITYANGQSIRAKDGAWNITASKFHRGAHIEHWAVMLVKDSTKPSPWRTTSDMELTGFVERFKQKCLSAGMTMGTEDPTIIETPDLQRRNKDKDPSRTAGLRDIGKVMEKLANANPRPAFILVLLSHQDHYIYPGIKRIGDVELGIHTVCMQVYSAHNPKSPNPKREDQYFSNVALKVNTKLGGINHKLDQASMRWLVEKRTMVVGADVTHRMRTHLKEVDVPDSTFTVAGSASIDGTPSLAAVAASVDSDFVQFPVSMRLQCSKEEMIVELKEMMKERLRMYQEKNEDLLPEHVLLFRDGVSEGQFDLVLSKELPAIQGAFEEVYLGPESRPKLMICICGKRHHARFYPTDANRTHNGNTKPGTVIDKGVGDVYRFDFFLQAHAGIQGTVKATHYTVVYDEIGFSADVLQQGTHASSYAYVRATRAVSLCPPVYYSDLACERGRLYLNDFYNLGAEKAGRQKGSKKEIEDFIKDVFGRCTQAWGAGVHPNIKDSMFYV